jgi:hypothetical protein
MASAPNRAKRAAAEFQANPRCIMHLETRKGDVLRFRAMFEIMFRVMSEGVLTFDAKGMRATMIGATHGEELHFQLPAEKNIYFFRSTAPVEIGLDFRSIYHQLRMATMHHRIILQYMSDAPNKLKLVLMGDSKTASTFSWDLDTIVITKDADSAPAVLQSVFDMRVSMEMRDFRQILAAAGADAEIQFLASTDALYTNAVSTSHTTRVNAQRSRLPLRHLKNALPPLIDESRPLTIDCIQSYGRASDKRDVYRAKYLHPFVQVNAISNIELFLGCDFPLVMRIPIGKMGHLMYVLASLDVTEEPDGTVTGTDLVQVSLAEIERLCAPHSSSGGAAEGDDEEEEEEDDDETATAAAAAAPANKRKPGMSADEFAGHLNMADDGAQRKRPRK